MTEIPQKKMIYFANFLAVFSQQKGSLWNTKNTQKTEWLKSGAKYPQKPQITA